MYQGVGLVAKSLSLGQKLRGQRRHPVIEDHVTIYAGATIMGDGRVALILDVLGIGQRSGVLVDRSAQAHAGDSAAAQAGPEYQRLLLFRAGCEGAS